MKHTVFAGLISILILSANSARDLRADPVTASEADRTAVEGIVAAQAEAWNHGDAKAFGKRFAPDGSFTNIVGATLYGQAAFIGKHDEIFKAQYKGSTVNLTIEKLRFIRSDVAVVDVNAKLSGFSRLPPGIRAFSDGALHTQLELVLTKEKAEWWISAYHNVAVLPPPPQQ